MAEKKIVAAADPKKLRRSAEERLTKAKPAIRRFKDVDRESLIHEMQVHQIELEMQNEELKRVKNELEALAGQYRNIYDFAPVGYLTLIQGGKIFQGLQANPHMVDLTVSDFSVLAGPSKVTRGGY